MGEGQQTRRRLEGSQQVQRWQAVGRLLHALRECEGFPMSV
jgi:hypothetical protein